MEGSSAAGADEQVRRRGIAKGLVDAGIALSSTLSLPRVLQILVDVARDLVGARYAAIGVLNPEKTELSEFITSGLTPEQRERLGNPPTGHGILGLLIKDARTIRLSDLRDHPASVGVPPHHPEMRSFLGVPVKSKGEIFGNLYVTEKLGGGEFDDEDVAILEMLASQAAVAIDNARLRADRDRFFASASHELGNAIAGVQLWAKRLLRYPPSEIEAWTEGVEKILAAADDAGRLVEDLLSLSRIQEGRITLEPAPVDLVELIRGATARLLPTAEAAGLTLTLSVGGINCAVRADPVRANQIIANLLGNAIKFTPAGGEIEVGVEMTGHQARAWVRDTGPGIAPEDQERIFLPYEQVNSVARGLGVGLGLSLSRKLARMMGGELSLESAPGEGSIFSLWLPLEAGK